MVVHEYHSFLGRVERGQETQSLAFIHIWTSFSSSFLHSISITMTQTTPLPPRQLLVLSLHRILQDIACWVLRPKDLAACVRVNRDWHIAFTPVLWYYFYLMATSRIKDSPALRSAINGNAHHVRYLACQSDALLGFLGPECTKAREFYYT